MCYARRCVPSRGALTCVRVNVVYVVAMARDRRIAKGRARVGITCHSASHTYHVSVLISYVHSVQGRRQLRLECTSGMCRCDKTSQT